jgi:hypothetical protein
MLYYILLIGITLASSLKPKLCVNCRYFVNDGPKTAFGTCSLFQRVESKLNYNLVDEHHTIPVSYKMCVLVREDANLCGKEGKLYKKKYVKRTAQNHEE